MQTVDTFSASLTLWHLNLISTVFTALITTYIFFYVQKLQFCRVWWDKPVIPALNWSRIISLGQPQLNKKIFFRVTIHHKLFFIIKTRANIVMFLIFKRLGSFWGKNHLLELERELSRLRALFDFCGGPMLKFQHPHCGSQPSLTPVPGNPSSLDAWRHIQYAHSHM